MADRLVGVLASLVFSIPTCLLLWLMINMQLIHFDTFVDLNGFLALGGFFALLAFLFPNVFPDFLAGIWNLMLNIFRWGI